MGECWIERERESKAPRSRERELMIWVPERRGEMKLRATDPKRELKRSIRGKRVRKEEGGTNAQEHQREGVVRWEERLRERPGSYASGESFSKRGAFFSKDGEREGRQGQNVWGNRLGSSFG